MSLKDCKSCSDASWWDEYWYPQKCGAYEKIERGNSYIEMRLQERNLIDPLIDLIEFREKTSEMNAKERMVYYRKLDLFIDKGRKYYFKISPECKKCGNYKFNKIRSKKLVPWCSYYDNPCKNNEDKDLCEKYIKTTNNKPKPLLGIH